MFIATVTLHIQRAKLLAFLFIASESPRNFDAERFIAARSQLAWSGLGSLPLLPSAVLVYFSLTPHRTDGYRRREHYHKFGQRFSRRDRRQVAPGRPDITDDGHASRTPQCRQAAATAATMPR